MWVNTKDVVEGGGQVHGLAKHAIDPPATTMKWSFTLPVAGAFVAGFVFVNSHKLVGSFGAANEALRFRAIVFFCTNLRLP